MMIESLPKYKMSKYGSGFGDVFRRYRTCAKARKHDFNLTRDEFYELSQSNCFYCGSKPKQITHSRNGNNFTYNGIDRYDNDLGYSIENSVPCCALCNKMKGILSNE